MTSFPAKRAIIIGGGIGGLSAGIALQRIGMKVTVFERADELLAVGSALPLWSNALRALQKLGLDDAIQTIGATVNAGSITTWQGDILCDLRTEELLKRLGTINSVVHRAELHAALLAALTSTSVSPEAGLSGGDDPLLRLGKTCVGFTQDKSGVCARFLNGEEARGDLLIGADGLHSVIRSQLFGANKPKYSGYTCWRGIAHIERAELQTWAWGKGYQFGITPMSNGRAYWWAQRYTPEGAPDEPGGRKHEVLQLFYDWHDPIPAVIEATQEKDILRNDVYESKHLRKWSIGRVTLLGDAAHAMTPNLGQGGCIAIEDAVVLAHCLKANPNVVAALKSYEKRRVRRTNTIASLANIIGRVVQLSNPAVCRMRDALVKRVPNSLLLRSMIWILDYHT